jgi:catechol 2,3-dioxygenase-like lactoylglutathione lyase family enzyme
LVKVAEILETCLYVRDLGLAKRFYGDTLGLELYREKEGRHLFFRCGGRMLLVFNPEVTACEALPHGGSCGAHVAFAVPAATLDQWREHLHSHYIPIELEATWPGGRSLYFRDPGNNSVELATPKIWELSEDDLYVERRSKK